MSLIQRFLHFILPASLFASMEAESKQWFIVCQTCGFKKSVWDMGGIRYKAASAGKVSYYKCPQCMQRRWFKWTKI